MLTESSSVGITGHLKKEQITPFLLHNYADYKGSKALFQITYRKDLAAVVHQNRKRQPRLLFLYKPERYRNHDVIILCNLICTIPLKNETRHKNIVLWKSNLALNEDKRIMILRS